jgi:hypothetical protein
MSVLPRIAGLFVMTWAIALPSHEASIAYFTNVRDVTIAASGQQNYVVLDPEVWNHARPDLADLRLYDGRTQVPYVLRLQRERTSNVEEKAEILNLGTVGDHAEFDLDVGAAPQYDRVRVQVDAKDFVNAAIVYGMDELGTRLRTQLGPATLYDFSREDLGSNFVLKVPTSSFRYLHVKLSPGIRPEQVKSATVFNVEEQRAAWMKVGTCQSPVQKGRTSVVECSVSPKAPLDQLRFEVPAQSINFRRNVRIADANGVQIANGDISRVRLKRGGHDVSSEELTVNIWSPHKEHFIVTIENGDDPPLPLHLVEPLAVQRRLYFDPGGRTSLKLYYGDAKLEPPIYDYDKFFQEDAGASQATLGPEMQNAEYKGRPDERPWSERHKSVMWIAMVAAVALLAGLAVRGLRNRSATQQ